MGALAIPLAVGGTLLQAYGQVQAGKQAAELGQRERIAKEFEASQYQQQAGQELASGQAAAMEQKRQAQLVSSRALALAAASGGGAADPGVVKLISNIAGEGEYRAGVANYRGEDTARKLNLQAEASKYEGALAEIGGKQKQRAMNISAFGSLLGSGGSLFTKYGTGGPNPSPVDYGMDTTSSTDKYGLRRSATNYY